MDIERICWYDGKEFTLKAVQITLDDGPFLALGYLFHGELLDSFLKEKEIPYAEMRLKDRTIHARTWNLPGQPFYNAPGMGKAKQEKLDIVLFDNSVGYHGMTPDPQHLEKLNKYLSDTKVRIK